jgi:hypothetical protein
MMGMIQSRIKLSISRREGNRIWALSGPQLPDAITPLL